MDHRRSSSRFATTPWMRWLVPVVLVVLALGLLGVLVLALLP